MRFRSLAELESHLDPKALAPVKSKYRNRRCEFQGQKFDSERELKTWKDLASQAAAGAIRAVIRQVSLPLPGSTRRARIDFLVVANDGSYRWLDAKGCRTPMSELKYRQLLQAYGILVELI